MPYPLVLIAPGPRAKPQRFEKCTNSTESREGLEDRGVLELFLHSAFAFSLALPLTFAFIFVIVII